MASYSLSKNPFYANSQAEPEFIVNVEWDFTTVSWIASTGGTVVFLHDTTVPPNASVAAGDTWTITAGPHAGGHLLTVDPKDPTRYDFTGGHIRFTKWDDPNGICKFEEVDLSGNMTEFVEGSTLGTFENPTAGYAWQAPTSFDFLGVYPYQASSTAPNGTVLRIKSDIDASRKSHQLRLFYQIEFARTLGQHAARERPGVSLQDDPAVDELIDEQKQVLKILQYRPFLYRVGQQH